MNKIILLHGCLSVMFFSYFNVLNGQTTFNKTIDTDNGADWGVSLLIEDDSIEILGTTDKLVNGFYRDGVFFRKLDLEGNIFREKIIDDSCVLYTVGYPENLVKVGNEYLTCGSYHYCDSVFEGGSGSKGMVYKFNEEGDTILTKKFYSQSYSMIYRGTLTKNNAFLCAGVAFDTATLINKFYIVKIDSAAEIIWEKTFGYLLNNYAFSIDAYTNGDFVISGLTDPTTNFSETDGYLAKLDSSCNIIWQKKNWDNRG